MKPELKITIITVCLNAEKTIEQTIKSVLNQEYSDLEYIIIDGNSSDSTIDIINKYKHNIAHFISEEDSGLYDAMNKGISLASGDIIGILNADDWYEADTIKKVLEVFLHYDVDIVYGNIQVWENEHLIGTSPHVPIDEIWYRMIPHPAVFVKGNMYKKYGLFDISYNIVADYDLIYRFYRNGARFFYTDKVLTNFRKGGISDTKTYQCAYELYNISMKYVHLLENNEEKEKIIKANFSEALIPLVIESEKKIFDNTILNDVELCILPAGKYGKRCYEKMLRDNIVCNFFLDNNVDIQYKYIDSVPIYPLEYVKNRKVIVVIACRNYTLGLERQLASFKNDEMIIIRLGDLYKC